jgi:hypothetical protein
MIEQKSIYKFYVITTVRFVFLKTQKIKQRFFEGNVIIIIISNETALTTNIRLETLIFFL